MILIQRRLLEVNSRITLLFLRILINKWISLSLWNDSRRAYLFDISGWRFQKRNYINKQHIRSATETLVIVRTQIWATVYLRSGSFELRRFFQDVTKQKDPTKSREGFKIMSDLNSS